MWSLRVKIVRGSLMLTIALTSEIAENTIYYFVRMFFFTLQIEEVPANQYLYLYHVMIYPPD